jgi:hypothetical protein
MRQSAMTDSAPLDCRQKGFEDHSIAAFSMRSQMAVSRQRCTHKDGRWAIWEVCRTRRRTCPRALRIMASEGRESDRPLGCRKSCRRFLWHYQTDRHPGAILLSAFFRAFYLIACGDRTSPAHQFSCVISYTIEGTESVSRTSHRFGDRHCKCFLTDSCQSV